MIKSEFMRTAAKKCSACRSCKLCENRAQTVFGAGNAESRVLMIGEAPGEVEDLRGIPFVGPAGNLLTEMLEAVGINRATDVFLTNLVKCRPPGNRTPTNSELEACSYYLMEQLIILEPKIVVLIGGTAYKHLIDSDGKITEARGKWTRWPYSGDVKVMPIYHPSFILRNPVRGPGSAYEMTIEDLRQVRWAMGLGE